MIKTLWAGGGIQAVVNAIKNVVELILTLWDFLTNIIKSIITALGIMIQLLPKLMLVITTMPSWLISFATVTVGVCVAYFVMGREAGKSD